MNSWTWTLEPEEKPWSKLRAARAKPDHIKEIAVEPSKKARQDEAHREVVGKACLQVASGKRKKPTN